MEARIYVACLASYNDGTLFGRWVDILDMSEDEIGDEITKVIAESPTPGAEEWAIHDYDGELGKLASFLGENPNLENLARVVEVMAEHPDREEVVAELLTAGVGDVEAVNNLMETVTGPWDSTSKWAQEYVRELLEIPEHLENYIDWEAVARDYGMDYIEIDVGSGIYMAESR